MREEKENEKLIRVTLERENAIREEALKMQIQKQSEELLAGTMPCFDWLMGSDRYMYSCIHSHVTFTCYSLIMCACADCTG